MGVYSVKTVLENRPGCLSHNQKYTYSSNFTHRYLFTRYESIFHKKVCTEMLMVLLTYQELKTAQYPSIGEGINKLVCSYNEITPAI